MDIKKTIAEWVRSARKHADLSGEELGAKLALELRTKRGHTKGNISHWELGKHQPSLQQLMAISKITGVPLPDEVIVTTNYDQLLAQAIAEQNKAGSTNISRIPGSRPVAAVIEGDEPAGAVQVRRVKLKLSAGIVGFAVDAEEEEDNPIYFLNSWLEARGYRREALVAIRVKGQSMEPGLYDGDTVVINTADTKPQDGEVYAVNYEGEAVVKRLVRDFGYWWLVSDNPDQRRFPRKQCADEMCIVIGKVIHKQSERI